MQSFSCGTCQAQVYFENSQCTHCGSALAFDSERLMMTATPAGAPVAPLCANAVHAACNWLASPEQQHGFCRACALNETIPYLSDPNNLAAWQDLERAKKRLIYTLLRFRLPFDDASLPNGRLALAFGEGVMTGHDQGLITVNVDEADGAERERTRQHFDEPYRTLLGHFRHESGHFYWDILIKDGPLIDRFREIFGDERADYAAALDRHYNQGPPTDWPARFVSAYASMHPWEDWAETWAHYLHMVDVIETAQSTRVGIDQPSGMRALLPRKRPVAPYATPPIKKLIAEWTPLSIAMNNLCRSMGHGDFYPFVMPAAALPKLEMVGDAIRAGRH
ncbi:MAG: putative zinc-binding metallopeptidase [Hyphomicrobiaceae bacterium]|nr:putative zinc-binding metallopeptidase [Hyphomicrobiaceae bacterium]